ncbi:uncharacterized protein LOC116252498 isoform X1 [Nymphaea colorata]|nr:uncharacterized protein LOC116252498 isoform X1 [Nymphaea colorata]XP_031482666.1 uncharacterized protein LOC116252498 isoform X1 [Nymphaea colorata]
MPPRSAKKASGTPTPKKSAGKSTKAAAQKQPEAAPPEVVKVQEEVVEEVPVQKLTSSNGAPGSKEEEMKASYDDYDKGERLELEDNEPESEPEEYGGIDYGDKELDQADEQAEIEEVDEEDVDEGDEGEEDGDMVEEEIEDEGEEIDGEGEEENDEGDHDTADEEEEEHHELVKERRKRKEFEIFVGGLDKDATEDDLKKVFSQVGEVTEVRLMMNPLTKKNKGFAFLRFATVEQAKRAVEELKNPVVNGKQCGVSPSQDSDTLFVGNICKTWTKEALKDKLKSYGIENIEDLTLVEDSNAEGMNRGFAFLEFSSRADAMDAYKRLQKKDVVFGVDRTAKVSFADSFIEPDDEIMAQVRTVFVDGLPASWDEERVKDKLKKFGEIEKIELARNMPSAKRKDFGFVTFDTHDAAIACAEGINNTELGEGDNKVKVRARLSRPHQKGRGVRRSVRGDHRLGRGGIRGGRAPWGRGALRFESRRFPARVPRGITSRGPPPSARGFRRPFGFRDRRPVAPLVPERARHMPPSERSYERRPPAVPAYPKSSSRRDYGRHEELPPRSRPADFGPRMPAERRPTYRDEYPRGSGYSDRAMESASRGAARRAYEEEGYGRRLEQPPSYRDGRGRDYDSVSGSKRPYSSMSDVPSRYADARQSRARLDYGVSSASAYGVGSYGESARLGRSSHLYSGSSRNSLGGQDAHGFYDSRGMGYGGGSVGGSDAGSLYSSSYRSDYLSGGSDVGGSYSSLYSSRGLGGSGYLGGSGSGSYY